MIQQAGAPDVVLRQALPRDAELVAVLIKELATYEQVLNETEPDVAKLRRDLDANANPRLYCLVAEVKKELAAFAAYYLSYSTNRTTWSIHVQDIFVRETFRGRGIGTLLMQGFAEIAKENRYGWIELEVLTQNGQARAFYEHLGFVVNPEATKMYLEFEQV
jgi:ribosomal protein S18 acetylase RimI-like enzyme